MISTTELPSTRPYLIRALYDWCTENGFTPYVAVKVDASVQVPHEYVQGGEIVLNVSMDATSSLKLGNDFIEFKARFGGKPREIMVPIHRVMAIYARENGQLGILYGDLNSARLPIYHRLDATLKRVWKSGKNNRFEAALAATNVYNRGNIFYYDAVKRKRVNQLPIMPTLMLSYAF